MPQPKAATSRAKPERAAAELVAGEHELGDVGGAGDEHHGAGGQHQRADERSLRTPSRFVGRVVARPASAAGR